MVILARPLSLHARVAVSAAIAGLSVQLVTAGLFQFWLSHVVSENLNARMDTQVAILRHAIATDGHLQPDRAHVLPDLEEEGTRWGWQVTTPAGHWQGGQGFGGIVMFPGLNQFRHRIYSAHGRGPGGAPRHVRLWRGREALVMVAAPDNELSGPETAAVRMIIGALVAQIDRRIVHHLRRARSAALAMDREDVAEILGNLLDNACRHARGAVVLGAVPDGQRLHVWVEDDGPGIAPEEIPLALSAGARLDESREGYGFGLAIVQELVELYGGTLALGRPAMLGGWPWQALLPGLVMREPPVAVPGFAKVRVWHDRTHRDPARRWLRERMLSAVSPMAPPTGVAPESRSAL